jgi:RNA polymerase sigma-70 factor, ECF subfamily
MVGSVELAEDIAHDCFLSLIKRPENFDPARGSLKTYLYSAARNLSLKHFRSTAREATVEEFDEEPSIPVSEQPLSRLLDEELSLKVKEAVFSLPQLQREALVLFEYEGLPLSEIASVVGADIGAVKARLHRARQRLRNTLWPYLNSSREIVTLKKGLI